MTISSKYFFIDMAENDTITWYEEYVQGRSYFSYIRGLFSRYFSFLRYKRNIRISINNGAHILGYSTICKQLAKISNSNLTIGSHSSIQSSKIDLRNKVKIGSYVIIGQNNEIITTSHNIDSAEWEVKNYGIEIEDYVWISSNVLILPSCRKIGRGAVIGAGSVVVSNVEEMSVVGGNPAKFLRKRKCVHDNLIVERLLHGDYLIYKETYKRRKECPK